MLFPADGINKTENVRMNFYIEVRSRYNVAIENFHVLRILILCL